MPRRTSRPKGDLTAFWNFKEDDIMFSWSKRPQDGHMIYSAFSYVKGLNSKTFVEELESRGYDLTTLKFSIKYKEKLDEI